MEQGVLPHPGGGCQAMEGQLWQSACSTSSKKASLNRFSPMICFGSFCLLEDKTHCGKKLRQVELPWEGNSNGVMTTAPLLSPHCSFPAMPPRGEPRPPECTQLAQGPVRSTVSSVTVNCISHHSGSDGSPSASLIQGIFLIAGSFSSLNSLLVVLPPSTTCAQFVSACRHLDFWHTQPIYLAPHCSHISSLTPISVWISGDPKFTWLLLGFLDVPDSLLIFQGQTSFSSVIFTQHWLHTHVHIHLCVLSTCIREASGATHTEDTHIFMYCDLHIRPSTQEDTKWQTSEYKSDVAAATTGFCKEQEGIQRRRPKQSSEHGGQGPTFWFNYTLHIDIFMSLKVQWRKD